MKLLANNKLIFMSLLILGIIPNGYGQKINSNIFSFLSTNATNKINKNDQNQVYDVYKAQNQHLKHVEVLVNAKVYKILKYDTRGLPHERFLIKLDNNTTILIAHDIKMAPCVPLKDNMPVTIKGEYIWNSLGGVIHWTHHTDTPFHVGGYIIYNGIKYE